MVIARITSKGQVTIPVEVRRALGVQEGDSLLFESLGEGEVRIRPVKKRRVLEFFGALRSEVPFPGKETVRGAVGEALGVEDVRESSRS
jgi:AbrB family looped-hinge helix DNA binding protein